MAEIKIKTKILNLLLFFSATKGKTITVGVLCLWRCSDTNLHVTQIIAIYFLASFGGDVDLCTINDVRIWIFMADKKQTTMSGARTG